MRSTFANSINTYFFLLSDMKPFLFAAFSLSFVILASLTNCFYDNEQEQYGIAQCDTTAMSFSADIKPIIEANCVSCHTPGGQEEVSPFNDYDGVVSYSDQIVERVKGVGSIMPPTGKLPACDQQKIESWVKAGAPNN